MGLGGSKPPGDALARLTEHKGVLTDEHLRLERECFDLEASAREQYRQHNSQHALMIMRQREMKLEQYNKLAGFIARLDAQKICIENRQWTDRTIGIVRECAQDLSRTMTHSSSLIDSIDNADELNEDVAEHMNLLSMHGTPLVTDDELLQRLTGGGTSTPAGPPCATVAAADDAEADCDDKRFLQWCHAQYEGFPDAPGHALGVAVCAGEERAVAQAPRAGPSAMFM